MEDQNKEKKIILLHERHMSSLQDVGKIKMCPKTIRSMHLVLNKMTWYLADGALELQVTGIGESLLRSVVIGLTVCDDSSTAVLQGAGLSTCVIGPFGDCDVAALLAFSQAFCSLATFIRRV